MEIKSVSFAAPMTRPSDGADSGKRARIEAQIKKLEERKRKLLEKLANMANGGGGDPKPPERPASHVPSGQAAADCRSPAVMGASTVEPASGQDAVPAPVPRITPPAPRTLHLSIPARPNPPPPADDDTETVDPKLILKMILSIDMMIMALRQQLNDEEMQDGMVLSKADEFENLLRAATGDGGHAYQNGHGDTVTISAEALRAAE